MILGDLLRRRFARLTIWLLLVSLAVGPATVSGMQDTFPRTIREAEDRFFNGDFDSSIAIVLKCLDNAAFPVELKQRAYELLAQNYLAKTYVEQARQAIRKLLELVPAYVPPPEDPEFLTQVERVRQEMPKPQQAAAADTSSLKGGTEAEQSAWYSSTWVWVGAGVVVAGVAALVLIKPTPSPPPDQKLPEPPQFP